MGAGGGGGGGGGGDDDEARLVQLEAQITLLEQRQDESEWRMWVLLMPSDASFCSHRCTLAF
jgi:hypothetical protein